MQHEYDASRGLATPELCSIYIYIILLGYHIPSTIIYTLKMFLKLHK